VLKDLFDRIDSWDGAFRRPGKTEVDQMRRWDAARAREGLPPMKVALAEQERLEREQVERAEQAER
jgi:hypothetical protein